MMGEMARVKWQQAVQEMLEWIDKVLVVNYQIRLD